MHAAGLLSHDPKPAQMIRDVRSAIGLREDGLKVIASALNRIIVWGGGRGTRGKGWL